MSRMLRTLLVTGFGLCGLLSASVAEAHGKFSFSLGLWGPPPVYYGPPCYDYYPPPVVYRRVYVTEPAPVYVAPSPAPAQTSRKRTVDPVLQKIGELHSDDAETREEAAQWLGQVRDPRAVRPLIDVLKHDPDHDVREDAARALGSIGSRDAHDALLEASESDPERDVRRAASKALARLAKEPSRHIRR